MCFYYDDYDVVIFKDTYVKCRKSHRCEGCGKVIQAGEDARTWSGKCDGSLFSGYSCEDCERQICSIAAEEIKHGCGWHEAWCSPGDLQEYLEDRGDGRPLEVLQGTLTECRQQVSDLWEKRREELMAKA